MSQQTLTSSNLCRAVEPAVAVARRELLRAIQQGELKPGDRVAPIRQLASRFGLSFSAVRSAVATLEQEGRLETRARSGTYVRQPCESSVEGDTAPRTDKPIRQVGLLVNLSAHVFGVVGQLLASRLQEQGVATQLVSAPCETSPQTMRAYARFLSQFTFDALVVPQCGLVVAEWLSDHVDPRIPVITYLHELWELKDRWHSVQCDLNGLSNHAVDHALSRGHRRIGYLTYSRVIRSSRHETLRKTTEGHTKYILALGHRLRERGLRHALQVYYTRVTEYDADGEPQGDPLHEENVASLTRWLDRPDRPTFLISDDHRLLPAIIAAQRLGLRIPDDIELLGIGNTPHSQLFNFPSFSYQEDIIAGHLANLLLGHRLSDAAGTISIAVPPRLIQRSGIVTHLPVSVVHRASSKEPCDE
ncbi:MAG: GntR family transcriptional regulator [Phycisphaeraceae bacterium]|nr:GntR family transcriptional regulator [Phycisphaeraceae bacterium]